jgi:hypothetical protein
MAAGLVPSCPEPRLCLRLTGEALAQPGPSREHVIQTRMYLTGTRH